MMEGLGIAEWVLLSMALLANTWVPDCGGIPPTALPGLARHGFAEQRQCFVCAATTQYPERVAVVEASPLGRAVKPTDAELCKRCLTFELSRHQRAWAWPARAMIDMQDLAGQDQGCWGSA